MPQLLAIAGHHQDARHLRRLRRSQITRSGSSPQRPVLVGATACAKRAAANSIDARGDRARKYDRKADSSPESRSPVPVSSHIVALSCAPRSRQAPEKWISWPPILSRSSRRAAPYSVVRKPAGEVAQPESDQRHRARLASSALRPRGSG
jgi:hypothetical protein